MTNMLRIRIDLRTMYSSLNKHRLPPHAADDGYRIHAYLQEVFDGAAPTPFRVLEVNGCALDVLAYSATERLPSTDRVDVAVKTMPSDFATGSLYRFGLVTCPVVRMASAGPRHKKGAEVDVFLRECWKQESNVRVDRYEVYANWLKQRFEAHGGADLVGCEVTGYRRVRLLRKTQGPERRSYQPEKPVVDFEGTVRVGDGAKFGDLLSRGIGRHRAFGFGMLLLKRSEC